MARFDCVCGQVIHISGYIPNPVEWQLLSDVQFTAFFEKGDEKGDGSVDVGDLYMETTSMYRCPRSGHLWIFWDGFDAAPALYSPTELPPVWLESDDA
jgi:hypothetical protein